jgi:CRP-like cAMP-binding protein
MFLSLAVKDLLWLRSVMTGAQVMLCTASGMSGNLNVAFWNAVFVGVNTYHVIRLVRERRPLTLPADIADIYFEVFSSMNRHEFLQFWSAGHVVEAVDRVLIRQGEIPKHLFLILAGSAGVVRDGRWIGKLTRKCFAGEMSLLTGEPASADVVLKDPVRYIVWDREILRRLSQFNPGFMSRVQQILGKDLVRKLRYADTATTGIGHE